MLGQPTLTDKLISFLSQLDDLLDYPKSFNQLLHWDKHQDYKSRGRHYVRERRETRRIKQALRRLEKAQVLTYDKRQRRYNLSFKGWLKFLYYYNKRQRQRPGHGKVGPRFVVVFDIPEEFARFRNLFRQCLKNLGFGYIQKSVWHTDNTRHLDFTQRIVANCELEGHVKFMEIKKIF